jgi:hypothetical protein
VDGSSVAGITGWLSWVTALLVAEWWLERRPDPSLADGITPRQIFGKPGAGW